MKTSFRRALSGLSRSEKDGIGYGEGFSSSDRPIEGRHDVCLRQCEPQQVLPVYLDRSFRSFQFFAFFPERFCRNGALPADGSVPDPSSRAALVREVCRYKGVRWAESWNVPARKMEAEPDPVGSGK